MPVFLLSQFDVVDGICYRIIFNGENADGVSCTKLRFGSVFQGSTCKGGAGYGEMIEIACRGFHDEGRLVSSFAILWVVFVRTCATYDKEAA